MYGETGQALSSDEARDLKRIADGIERLGPAQ